MSCKLTDDEVVAAAVLLNGSWPIAIRTVDLADAGAVAQAVARGERSLLVRELATARDGRVELSAATRAAFEAVSAADTRISVLVGRRSAPVAEAAPFVSAYRSRAGSPWTVVASSVNGVADIDDADEQTVRATLEQLLSSCYRDAIPGSTPSDDLALFVGRFDAQHDDLVEVTPGSVRRAVAPGGRIPETLVEWLPADWPVDVLPVDAA